MEKLLFTIGHSVLEKQDFIDLLKAYGIKVLVDVRAFPYSRRLAHFNGENLQKELSGEGITYIHMAELGGRRKFDPELPDHGWKNPSFAAYAQYLRTPEFKVASEKLANIALKEPTAIMCAEKLWWKCHRRLISDYFLENSWDVRHILEKNKADRHIPSSMMKGTQ